MFAQACATLGCAVEPPRAIDGLRQLDGTRVLELKVPLSNRASIALAWPSIELTLPDASNQVAARRVLSPTNYVRPGTPLGAGLAAGAPPRPCVRAHRHGAGRGRRRARHGRLEFSRTNCLPTSARRGKEARRPQPQRPATPLFGVRI
ncbi:MAG: DUF3426 domain-containing protein [Burkholderia sp.]